jgi:AcrR family transcriptional regulator
VFDTVDLLDLALDALASGGYRGLTMRGMARELGVSLASVQNRFATKDELWRAAIDYSVHGAPDFYADQTLAEIIEHRLAASASRPGLLLALLADDAPGHQDRHAYLAQQLGPAVANVREQLGEAQQLGFTRQVDAEVLLAVMVTCGAALGSLPREFTDALGLGADPAARLAQGLADLLLHGMLVR